jgi:hypothetical protein
MLSRISSIDTFRALGSRPFSRTCGTCEGRKTLPERPG